jgi:flagellar basal body-associated protein FliL
MAENEGTPGKGKDEIISLEKLVSVEAEPPRQNSVAGAPVPPSKTAASPATSPPAGASAAPPPADPNSVPISDDLDRLFALEDPGFADSLKELNDLKVEDGTEAVDDSDLDSVLNRELREAAVKGPKKLLLLLVTRPLRKVQALGVWLRAQAVAFRTTGIPAAKAGAKAGLLKTKSALLTAIYFVKSWVIRFIALPRASKFLLLGIVLLAAATVVVGMVTFRNKLLPSFQAQYIMSFAGVADSAYDIEKNESWENLNDPFLHPEHIVLIDRIITNLKPDSPTPNPMTLLDLFIETSSQEAAVELRDRESEARDVIGRTLNQMPYDEFTTVNGKNKVKIFLRKDLNDMMTKGRIRRVFFKSLIIKP